MLLHGYKSGNRAKAEMGIRLYNQEKYEEALKYLNSCSLDDKVAEPGFIIAAPQGEGCVVAQTADVVYKLGGDVLLKRVRQIVHSAGEHEVLHRKHKSERNTADIFEEHLKTALLEMLQEAGVDLLLYTFVCLPIMEEKRVKGVIVENKSGRQAIFAKIVIDCTGDGDIAARAGAAYRKGREEDGAMQPVSLMFKIGGVDYTKAVFPGKFEDYIQIPKGEIHSLGKQNLPFPAGHVLLYRTSLPGVVTCNMTNCIGIDGTSTKDLVKATLECRRQLAPILDFLRNFVPGYENCYLLSTASLIGVRETRHFEGLATITEEDIRSARVFPDWAVTYASFNFDVHNMTGNGLDATGAQAAFAATYYTIPYGCLVPREIDGLLLAGRNISGTHMAHANYR